MTRTLPLFSTFRATAKTIKRVLPQLIVFEISFKIIATIIILPLLSIIMQVMLSVSGFQIAFNGNIFEFLLTPYGVVAAVVMAIIAVLFIYYEYAVVIILVYSGAKNKPATLLGAMKHALTTFGALKAPSTLLFAFYVLVIIPLVDIGLSSAILPNLSIPNFITGEVAKFTGTPAVFPIALVVVGAVLLATIFTIPLMVLENLSFAKALKKNFKTIKSIKPNPIRMYGLFLAVWFVFYQTPQSILISVYTTSDVSINMIISSFGFSWETILFLVLGIIYFAAGLLLMPVLFSIVVSEYTNTSGEKESIVSVDNPTLRQWELSEFDAKDIAKDIAKKNKKIASSRWFKVLRVPVSLVLAVAIFFALARVFELGRSLHPPIVIGHRGSGYSIENTIEAIQDAIDAGAQFAEVDVLLSKDGVPMVVHDTNLLRLTGHNVMVYNLTAEELSQLTLSKGGKTSHISTLEEVIKYCDGKIQLAIEFKLHGEEKENLVDQVLKVVDDFDFLENCIFLSLEYKLIEEINTKRPESRAGYCVYGNVGILAPDLVSIMKIDFVVIEENMVSQSLIKDFRRAWLPVYVWTVNDLASMQRYLNMGILGIVTDDPRVAVAAVKSYNETNNIIYLPEDEQLIPAFVTD